MEQAIEEYLAQRQGSRQWRFFLSALAEEFATQLREPDLRAMMQRIGTRFASAHPLPAARTIADASQAMSACWDAQGWGWVDLEEHADHLLIRHYCSPLRAAFGQEHLHWTPAFLEGAYQQWFQALGSGSALRVQQSSQADGFGCVEFRLAQ
ncbi:cellulose biosynthesis protein BcsD [Verticiella sediminum]|uniref:cellulose biosynthesis protein BcsD n=1 Tax=Verticiella sediminum TaxID=1247510 RepID=UPI001FE52A33|nr:cellulose synthase [Verticiella sediminum]